MDINVCFRNDLLGWLSRVWFRRLLLTSKTYGRFVEAVAWQMSFAD